ncbi:enhancer of mRNA-decapping protein 4 [Trichonephila clavata]|uniref:Enhancer of mRNA-decapping protein 4 n=1 Tax=Trichonephila clavata TaxID=2740835 RepID=A0A8X6KDK2_TRICU|nr:enhancer of mRNA-decapping protein 4 [Trichonephila clavata]
MNGHSNIDTIEATEHLKNILNVGKSGTESVKLKTIANGNMEASGDGNLMLCDRAYQKINLCANKDSSHVSIYGTEVDVYSSPLEHGETCSQIIVEDMVDYGWEEKFYCGKLISIHLSGLYLAYVLKPANNKPGYVRLLRTQLDIRHLIKDYKSEVKDIAFAHTTSQVLLGSVDACGELFVHKISDDGAVILCNLLIRILRPNEWTPSEHNRIIWCLYIPEDNESTEDESSGEDLTTLLVVTHEERAEIWNVGTVVKEHGHGNLAIDDVKVGVQVVTDHKMPIATATFSPDGTALSIASFDGVVKFFQVNTLKKDISPRCLHQWIPHPQKSLCSLYFLDNYKNHKPDVQFWKFAVTGAENNTEIKVWSCETWSVLQTIRIHPNPSDSVLPCLKAEIDLSSKYLFLSDIKRKVLFILHMEQEPEQTGLIICSLSEYRVPLPVLSLAVANVSHSKSVCKNSDDEGDKDQMGDCLNDVDESPSKYTIKLYWIQTKTLQSCRILYTPKLSSPLHSVGSVGSLSQESFVFKDGLSDISIDSKEASNRSVKDLDLSMPKGLCGVDELSLVSQSTPTSLTALPTHISNYQKCAEVLLTPDDFTSPSHSNLSGQNSFSLHEDMTSSGVKCDSISHLPDGIDSLPVESSTLQRRKSSQHSATSSPSREVAEILAPTKVHHLDEITNETSVSVKDGVESVNNNLASYATSGASESSRNQTEYHMKNWPQAPDPNKDYTLPSRNEDELQGHGQHFNSDNREHSVFQQDMNVKFDKLSQNFNNHIQKLDAIIEVMQVQNSEIQRLQKEIKILRHDQIHNQVNTKDSVSSKLDHVITQNLVSHYSKLENLIIKMAEEDRRRTDCELITMSGEIASTFGSKLDSTLKQELASNIVPQINRVLDTIAQKMQLDFSQKLSATDTSLRDSFTKHLKGKPFMDSLSQVLSASLQGVVQSACKDVFQNSVVPSFDKACQHLFQQLNEQFNKGTVEYIQTLDKHAQKTCATLDNSVAFLKEEINTLVSGAQQAIQTQAIKVENHSLDLMKQHEMLLSDMRQVVQEEVRKTFREQTNAVLNSRSTTPVPYSDPQLQKQQLMQLVTQGSINEAFQQALSAMDVQLVLFLCESVNVDLVFGPTPCPLQQHVLLSLVNQLSADFNTKTEIRVRYIEDVIASLDSNDPIIKDHIRGVLDSLQQRIITFLCKNPTHKLTRNLRRISLAIKALIK